MCHICVYNIYIYTHAYIVICIDILTNATYWVCTYVDMDMDTDIEFDVDLDIETLDVLFFAGMEDSVGRQASGLESF